MSSLSPRAVLGLLAAIAFSVPAASQTQRHTTHTLHLGGNNTFSCRGAVNPATLSDGVTEATADIVYSYDSLRGVLEIDVLNTSPALASVPNPILDAITLNLPEGAVDGAQLLVQIGTGGAAPNFSFSAEPDLSVSSTLSVGCFGNINVLLDARGTIGGIANPIAPTLPGLRANYTLGVTTFRIQLSGPGIGFLTARTIALQFSRNQPLMINASVNFRDGGVSSAASGEISSPHNACFPTLWTDGPPRLGDTVRIFAAATTECHTCVIASLNPGPSQLAGITIPIGLPAVFLYQIPSHPKLPVQVPLSIPNEPSLVGQTVYLMIGSAVAGLELSEQLPLTFVQ